MVRTRDSAVKVTGGKATRKISHSAAIAAASASSKAASPCSANKYSGGNPYFPRETPSWQKPITNFLISTSNGGEGSSSKHSTKVDTASMGSSQNGSCETISSSSNGSDSSGSSGEAVAAAATISEN